MLPRPLLSFLPAKEAAFPRSLALPRQTVRHQAFPLTLLWQLLIFLLAKEAILPWQLLTFPQVKAAVLPRLMLTFLPGKEAMLPRPLLSFTPAKEAVFPRPLALPRQVSLAIQQGQSGRAIGIPPGTGHPSLPRRLTPSPRKTTPPPLPSRPPQGSSNEGT